MGLIRTSGGPPNVTQLTLAYGAGAPQYLGTITANAVTAQTNANTAVPFTIPPGSLLLLQTSADCYYLPSTSASFAVTAAGGVQQIINQDGTKFLLFLEGGQGSVGAQSYVSILSASGTVNVKVFALG